jgi:hypothetical protein
MKGAFQILILLLFMALGAFVWHKIGNFGKFFENNTEVTQQLVLQQVSSMGKVELVNYQFRDVVESEIQKTLLPNAKALLIISGKAVGCIDLTKITATDINQHSDSLFIRLPAPVICQSAVDHSQSRVYDVSLFSILDQSTLIDEAYKKAEEKINDTAIQMGILEQTKTNADKILKPLLEKLSGKKVRFFYSK